MEEKEITLRELIVILNDWKNYFLSKYKIIIFCILLGGAIGVGYASLQKPIYVANLSFALEEEKSGGGGLSGAHGLASQLGFDLGVSAGGAFNPINLTELMKTRSLIEKTLLSTIQRNSKEETLVEFYIENNQLRKAWKGKSNLELLRFDVNSNRNSFSLQQDSILGEIYKKIKQSLSVIQKDKKVSILTIELKDKNELFAKKFTEQLASVVSAFYIETKSKKALLNVKILERQADSVRNELNTALGGVASANDVTFNLNPALNSKRVNSAKKQIDVQANSTILTQLVANLEIARVSLRKETPLIQIIDSPILPLEIEKPGKKNCLIIGVVFATVGIFSFLVVNRILQKAIR